MPVIRSEFDQIKIGSLTRFMCTQIPTSATLAARARKFAQEIKRDLGGAAGAMEAFREGGLSWQRCNRTSGAVTSSSCVTVSTRSRLSVLDRVD